MWMIGLLSPPDDAVRASLAARIQRSRQERNIASDTREVRLDRRQKAGLTLIGIWVVIVIVIARSSPIASSRWGLLGVCPALAFPFRNCLHPGGRSLRDDNASVDWNLLLPRRYSSLTRASTRSQEARYDRTLTVTRVPDRQALLRRDPRDGRAPVGRLLPAGLRVACSPARGRSDRLRRHRGPGERHLGPRAPSRD